MLTRSAGQPPRTAGHKSARAGPAEIANRLNGMTSTKNRSKPQGFARTIRSAGRQNVVYRTKGVKIPFFDKIEILNSV
jgi:hypothetical protein